jgi:hypothetical protein
MIPGQFVARVVATHGGVCFSTFMATTVAPIVLTLELDSKSQLFFDVSAAALPEGPQLPGRAPHAVPPPPGRQLRRHSSASGDGGRRRSALADCCDGRAVPRARSGVYVGESAPACAPQAAAEAVARGAYSAGPAEA